MSSCECVHARVRGHVCVEYLCMSDIVSKIRHSPALQFLRSSGREKQYPKDKLVLVHILKRASTNGDEYSERKRHSAVKVQITGTRVNPVWEGGIS